MVKLKNTAQVFSGAIEIPGSPVKSFELHSDRIPRPAGGGLRG